MDLRGELYRIIASSLGAAWRSRLQEIETTPSDEIKERSLTQLLRHAVARVPYYRSCMITTPRLESFPILSRNTLRTRFKDLRSDNLLSRHCTETSTGGSTGEPVSVIHDSNFRLWNYATDMYYMSAFYGMPYLEYLRSRRVAIWHRRRRASNGRLKQLGAKLLRQLIYIEPYEIMTEQKLNEHVRRINRHKPSVILAFAGTLFEIAKHAQQSGMSVHSPRFILSSVEMLYPAMRATIEEVFDCPVYDRYGAAEVGRVAAECPKGKLHVFSFNNHVEILNPDNTPTEPGEVGRIVITCLHNLAMPLIRYDIGDLARVPSKPCRCGSPLPIIDELCGRVIHHFVRPDGTLVFGGSFMAMFYELDWIMCWQRSAFEPFDVLKLSHPGGCSVR